MQYVIYINRKFSCRIFVHHAYFGYHNYYSYLTNQHMGIPHTAAQPRFIILCDDVIIKPDKLQTLRRRKVKFHPGNCDVTRAIHKSHR
jgi:hypothetical protein